MGLSVILLRSGTNNMTKKIVDLMSYKLEKTLRESGFTLKRDGEKKVKLLIKLSGEERGVKL